MISKENIEKLKNYVYPNGKYSNIHSNSVLIKKHFFHIYEEIKDNYHTKLYMLCNDISEIPTCQNPDCNNKVKLKSIGAGFRKYCSNACIGLHQKNNKEFSNKISSSLRKKHQHLFKERYPDLDVQIDKNDKNYYIIKNYCKHGDIKIYSNIFIKLYKQNKNLCQECKKEIVNNYIPSESEILKFQNKFNEFYENNSLNLNDKWFITYYPKEYKIILYWSNNIKNINFNERIYLFKNNLKELPTCLNPTCKNKVTFCNSKNTYNKFCKSYSCVKNISAQEIELLEYVKTLNETTESKFFIDKREFDIFIKNKNILIDYNGLYWHSTTIINDQNYHYNKWKLANSKGYQLLTIWEDDWKNKQELVKSMIKNKLGLSTTKIYARNCVIKNVTSKDNKKFCDLNHIQGAVAAKIKVGLYYDNELVSLMTFGNKRNVLGQKSSEGEYELLRFCSKMNTNVIGGASKLFKYFIRTYNPYKIISYANCDISVGELYKKLNFKEIEHTGLNYWWSKNGVKYHRSNFQKHKLVNQGYDKTKTENQIMTERGFNKIYGTGNIRYEWENKKRGT